MSSLPITNLLNQAVLIAPYSADLNDMGDITYGTPTLYRCRIDFSRSLVYGLDGVQVPSVATVYTDTMVGAKDKLMIPLGDDFSIDTDTLLGNGWDIEGEYISRVPLSVKTLYDGRGNFSHSEVSV